MDDPATVVAREWPTATLASLSGILGRGGAGAGRESREDTHRVGKVDAASDEGVKNEFARCTSGVEARTGGVGSDSMRVSSGPWSAPTTDRSSWLFAGGVGRCEEGARLRRTPGPGGCRCFWEETQTEPHCLPMQESHGLYCPLSPVIDRLTVLAAVALGQGMSGVAL